MARGLPLIIAAIVVSLAGCARPALPQREGVAAQPIGLVAIEAGLPGDVPRSSASSRESIDLRPEPGITPAAEPTQAFLTGADTPTLEPSPAPTAQPTALPTAPPPSETTATPTPIPKPGPDEPFAYISTYLSQAVVLLDTVPALPQLRTLSCEAATIRMVLAARGVEASEEDILARMPKSENPHLGFRGDPEGDGHDADLKDYGAYAEVVAEVLRSFGVPAEAVRGMSEWELRQTVRGGKAVIVWVTAEEAPKIIEGDGYRLVEGEHVYVVVGLLKDGRLLVHDPWGVRADSGRPGTFPVWLVENWELFDRQAVVIPLS